ncbi:MAG: NINE protein [Phycisphaerales bacterium]|nr:NINE protein [Phycisphaerales bacterium]
MRSTWVGYLLWIPPLGLLGLHRFYCGRVWSGVLWLLTGGLVGIGWLVDVFLVPSMVRGANLIDQVGRHEALLTCPRIPYGAAAPFAEPPHRVIYCVGCGSAMQVPVAHGGRGFRCPSCGQAFIAPALAVNGP